MSAKALVPRAFASSPRVAPQTSDACLPLSETRARSTMSPQELRDLGLGPRAPRRVAIARRTLGVRERQDLDEARHVSERTGIGQHDLDHDRAPRDLRPHEPARGLRPPDDVGGVVGLAAGRHDRGPGDRAIDRLREGGELVDEEVGAPGRFDDADPAATELAGQRPDLGELGESARNRTTIGADVRSGVRGREADRTGLDRLADDPPHRLDLGVGRRTLGRGVAHHVLPHGRVADIRGHVEAQGQAGDGREVFREGLEAPRNARFERLERHPLHVLEDARDRAAVLRPRRRDAEAAVAHDDGGDAMPGRGRQVRVPEDLRVVVRVHVDEARRDDETLAIDDGRIPSLRRLESDADGGDALAIEQDVSLEAGGARSVDDEPAAQEGLHRCPFPSRSLFVTTGPMARQRLSDAFGSSADEISIESVPDRAISAAKVAFGSSDSMS
jgi:hypothetical protein